MKKIKKRQYYKITWTDHFSESGWQTTKEIKKWIKEQSVHKCVTVGMISFEDEDFIVISASQDGGTGGSGDEVNFGESLAIFKHNIVKKVKVNI